MNEHHTLRNLKIKNQRGFGPSQRQNMKTPSTTLVKTGLYDGKELARQAVRPGAMHAYTLPSRVLNRRHYPNGVVLNIKTEEDAKND